MPPARPIAAAPPPVALARQASACCRRVGRRRGWSRSGRCGLAAAAPTTRTRRPGPRGPPPAPPPADADDRPGRGLGRRRADGAGQRTDAPAPRGGRAAARADHAPAGPPRRCRRRRVGAARARGLPGHARRAVAQLAALTEVGLEGGDPQHYRRAYEAVALPGAPAGRDGAALPGPAAGAGRRVGLAADRTGARTGVPLDPDQRAGQGQHRRGPLPGGLRAGRAGHRAQRPVAGPPEPVTARRSAGSAMSGGSAPGRPPRRPRWPGRAAPRPFGPDTGRCAR